MKKIILLLLVTHCAIAQTDPTGNVENISTGQFEYAVIDVQLSDTTELELVDSIKMMDWISERYKLKIQFNPDFVAMEGLSGPMSTRMVYPLNADSVYIFLESSGGNMFGVNSKQELTEAYEGTKASLDGMKIDTISEKDLGLNPSGINVIRMLLDIHGQKSIAEYATNINIDLPIPIHRFPILGDRILTRFEMKAGGDTIVFGLVNFKNIVTDESIFSLKTEGYKRQN